MRSLRSRLTFTHALVALVAVIIVATLTTVLIRRGFDRLANQRAQADADNAAELLAVFYQRRGGWDKVEPFLRQRVAQLNPNTLIQRRRLQLFDATGDLIFDSARPIVQRRTPVPEGGVQRPVIVDDRTVGTVVIGGQAGDLTQAERDFVGRVYLSVIAGSVLAGLVALMVGLVIAGRVTRPLRSLQDAAQRLASGARHEPLPIPPDRELAELALSFNTMASELEHQQHLRRQLVADIAHELRTPLSVLRLQLEGLEDGIEQPTPDTLHSLSEEVGLLTRLVDDLRLLSLADAGQLSLAIAELEAVAAVERAVMLALPRARQQRIELRAERPAEALIVMADPQRLAQVLGNLIENALRYTPAGGIVTVRVSSEFSVLSSKLPSLSSVTQYSTLNTQHSVVFEVADTGAGIPPDELGQIFERFYRADKARARETGGSGLGLAIVQRLVEMQGGRIWASSTVGSGTIFHVMLPGSVEAGRREVLGFTRQGEGERRGDRPNDEG